MLSTLHFDSILCDVVNVASDDGGLTLSDETLRSKLRSKYPGAGAIEFENFIQIMMEDCLGWDIIKMRRIRGGMFGRVEAFGGTVEEQDRRTLHCHLLVWLQHFDFVRNNMFSENPDVRERA